MEMNKRSVISPNLLKNWIISSTLQDWYGKKKKNEFIPQKSLTPRLKYPGIFSQHCCIPIFCLLHSQPSVLPRRRRQQRRSRIQNSFSSEGDKPPPRGLLFSSPLDPLPDSGLMDPEKKISLVENFACCPSQ